MSLLVVEDDNRVAHALVALLTRSGFETVKVPDGRSALQALDSDTEMVLLDLGLPDMNGRELAEKIRERLPGIPVLFATGRTSEDCSEGLDHAAMIAKPYDDAALDRAVRSLLGEPSPS